MGRVALDLHGSFRLALIEADHPDLVHACAVEWMQVELVTIVPTPPSGISHVAFFPSAPGFAEGGFGQVQSTLPPL